MNKLLSFALATGTATMLMMAPVASVQAQTVTLKFSNVTSQSGKDAGVYFIKVAEEASNGTLKIEHYPDNQLGDDRSVVESTIFGDIDLVISSTSPLSNIIPDFYIFDAPFLFLSTEEAYAGLDGETGMAILDSMSGAGLKGLAMMENGFRNYTNNAVGARVPADVKNMKIRTMENEVHMAAWRALGANPTPMAFTELFTAMQQGTVDGEENPLGIIDGNKFQEVQKYLSLTQHVYTPYVLCMNMEKFNSLNDVQKAAILKAAKEALDYQRKRSQELETEILERVQKEGMTVATLTPEEKAQWRKIIDDAKIMDLVRAKMKNPSYVDTIVKR